MKKYEVIYETEDERVWQVVVEANGFRIRGDLIVFYIGRRWWPVDVAMFHRWRLCGVVQKKG